MQTTLVGKWGRTEEKRWPIKDVLLSRLPPRELKLKLWHSQSGKLNRVVFCASGSEELHNWHLGVASAKVYLAIQETERQGMDGGAPLPVQ